SVSGIAGIYPVCNLESYPGLKKACGAFGLTEKELKADLENHNPIDRLGGLAEAGVPVFHLHGDSDTLVPLKDNSAMVSSRYAELGGEMTLEIAQGQGHNMWSGWFESENLTKFVLSSLGRPLNQHPVPESDLWLTFSGGDGLEKRKHIVLVAADQEYRSEQSMPMLAGILSTYHGFDCTVLFSVDEKGDVNPTIPAPLKDDSGMTHHRIPGLQHLAKADCVILLTRFMQLPEGQLKLIHDYLDSGKPLIALRTANHGFWRDFGYRKGDRKVSLREIFGGTFMGHHGGWHRESTRGIIVPENASHPILVGVKDVWGPSDVYRCHNENHPLPDDCLPLLLGQPLVDLTQDAEPNLEKEALPIAWVKQWIGNQGKESKIFHFTMGSAKDFESEGVRRAVVNAVYWGLGMVDAIAADSNVEPIGSYTPLKSGFNYDEIGVHPRKPRFFRPMAK
ncbi:MAG: ThuA domain-containing protein, partial [Planctomycetota bacterium]